MKPWKEIISEAKSKRQQELEDKVSELDDIPSSLKKGKSSSKSKEKKKASEYTKYLARQLKFKSKKYEDQKKKELENIKKKAGEEHKERAKSALKSIKTDIISDKDRDPTAYSKALGNISSLAGGLAAAGYHGTRALLDKKAAEKKARKRKEKQIEKKERKSPGRRRSVSPGDATSTSNSSEKKLISGSPEPKRLLPSTKRLPPASKKIAPSGGTPYTAEPSPTRSTGMSLGQRARRNPELKKRLIAQREEEYSDWKYDFLYESGLIVEVGEEEKVKKEKIIDIMKGKNKIEINPQIAEDHKEIASGKKKDDEGYMANVELDQMERAIKALRKKLKKSDMQLPAWVQSKITRAADYVDTASEYLQSDEGLSEEKEEKRYCKLCRKEESKGECSYGPSMWEKYTISEMAPLVASLGRVALGAGARTAATTGARAAVSSSLKDAAKEKVMDITKEKLKSKVKDSLERAGSKVRSDSDDIRPEDGNASAYGKALSNIIGEELDKKKALMLIVLKALEDKKRKKNSQLINGIIGESKKSNMKCNKPKAEAHGSGESGKSHVVKACEDGKEKLIRFGQLGVKGSPKKEGESEEYASRRNRFKTRHAKNIAKGKMSAAFWANKVKW